MTDNNPEYIEKPSNESQDANASRQQEGTGSAVASQPVQEEGASEEGCCASAHDPSGKHGKDQEDWPSQSAECADGACEDDPRKMSNAELGRKGETAACRFLERKGFVILERNWTCAAGEADIIATIDTEYGSELHFVEVKTRMSTATGFPEEAVNFAKRRRYELIAELYVRDNHCDEARVTFDIISILVTAPDRAFLRMHCNVMSCDCY